MTTEGIEGECVRLRALCQGDLEVLRSFVNDVDVMQFSNQYRPISDVEQEEWFQRMVRDRDSIWFGIADRQQENGPLVGTCTLTGIDWVSRLAELRIRLGCKEKWGKGIGTEATRLLIQYAFWDLNLKRLWLRVFASNARAFRMYEKQGFQVEGRQRRATLIRGEMQDVILMGLLREEWETSDNRSR